MRGAMPSYIEIDSFDWTRWVALVETGDAADTRLRGANVALELPLKELAPYFAPLVPKGFRTFERKKGTWSISPRVTAAEDRRHMVLEVPSDHPLADAAFTPAMSAFAFGRRRDLAELESALDPAAMAWRSAVVADERAFAFGGARPSAKDLETAEKIFAKLDDDAGVIAVEKKEKLRCLPEDLSRFTKASSLRIYNTGLKALSAGVGTAPAIQDISVWYSPLCSVSPEIGKLKDLQRFEINCGSIHELPEEMGDLPLQSIVLATCAYLEILPESFERLRTLKWLTLRDTPASGDAFFGSGNFPDRPENAAARARVEKILANNPGCELRKK